MPVEIRELIIKTEISANGSKPLPGNRDKNFERMKKQLLEECKRIITLAVKKNNGKR